MGILNKNINFVWYGDNCESCTDFDFYSGTSIRSEFENVLRVVDIKDGGFVYAGWSLDIHKKNLKEFEKLPDIIKNTLGSDYLKNGQGFDKLKCGRAYIIEVEEGVEVSIPNVFPANLNDNPPRRLVNPCPTCPEKTECGCTKKTFVFKNFNIDGEEFAGWDDPLDACFANKNGTLYEMVLTTTDPVVGTKLYLTDRIEPSEFLGTYYQDDVFSLEKQYIYSENKIYLINNRTIDEIIECDDIKPTPTPELNPPVEKFCIRYSSVKRNNGTYVLQKNKHNKYPVWFNEESNMYSYYQKPAGASEKRWMISKKLGSKYGQFADVSKGSGPYEVTWDSNPKYYHTLVTGDCEDAEKFWISRGACINGERVNTKSGDSVAINEDGTIIAFGAEKNSDGSPFGGQVRVFRWENNKWKQMGSDLEHNVIASRFGHSLSLNSDGSVLAIGAYNDTKTSIINPDTDKNVGSVQVFKWNTSNDKWEANGDVIYGKQSGSRFGTSCHLNATGDLLVVGSSKATENVDSQSIPTGAVELYNFENGNWNQLGQTIYGEHNSGFGNSTCISSLSTKKDAIIGVVGDKICEVYHYTDEQNAFFSKGVRINLPSVTTTSNVYNSANAPSSISMNKYGDRVAVGIQNVEASTAISNIITIGEVHTFQYDGVGNWNKIGQTLNGQVTSLKLSESGSTLLYSSITQTVSDSNIDGELVAPGAVFAYEFIDSSWHEVGSVLYGKTHLDEFGYALDFTIHANKIILVSSAPSHTIYSSTLDDYLGQICVYESPPEFFEEIPSPIDCVYTQSAWTECSQICDPDGSGPGTQTRTTTVISEPVNGGLECPGATIIQTCGEDRCPIDCQVSDWNWSGSCSEDCDGGIEVATRDIIVNNQFGGATCPTLETTRPCNTFVCPEDCEGSFEEISSCTVSCGGGVRQLAFNVTKPEIGTGICPNRGKIIEEECNLEPCPVDCVGGWSDWSQCTASCDGGKQTRSFVVSESEKFGGVCPDKNKIETRDCNTHGCPRDCEGYYTSWTSCSKTCGTGTQTKSFVVTKSEANGGNCVNRGSVLSQPCNTTPCPENCEGHWGDYGACTKTCGGGTQTRNFVVTKNELYGGICPNRDGSETRSCNSNPCPRDCSGYWSSWSSCSKTCGGGSQTRNFIVRTSEAYGGVCPDKGKRETRECNTTPCPTNCEGYWSSWSACSKDCGGGTQTRSFVVSKSEANGGSCINRNKTETRNCNTQCCKQDCEGYWTEWGYNNVVGKCSKCGNGQQTRKWVMTKNRSCGGKCDHYNGKTETRNATESECGCCPENCKYGWKKTCNQEDNKINPPDNLIYEMEFPYVETPAKCGGTCGSIDASHTRYDWCDEKGPPLPAYKVTGFGGENGDKIESLMFYPIWKKGAGGSGKFLLRVGPEGKSWNTRKVEPPQGYYEHTCMDHTGSLNDYTITPCDGNRKYVYMTKAYTPDPKPSLYSTYWRYQLHWGYRAARTCSYSFIPIGKSSGWCPHWREHSIKNEDGSFRQYNDTYGWILSQQFYSYAPSKYGSATRVTWRFANLMGWSLQPSVTRTSNPEPSTIADYYSPFPKDGEILRYANYKWGRNYSDSHSSKYSRTLTEMLFTSEFGKIEKVKTIDWGEGHWRKSSTLYEYMD